MRGSIKKKKGVHLYRSTCRRCGVGGGLFMVRVRAVRGGRGEVEAEFFGGAGWGLGVMKVAVNGGGARGGAWLTATFARARGRSWLPLVQFDTGGEMVVVVVVVVVAAVGTVAVAVAGGGVGRGGGFFSWLWRWLVGAGSRER